MTFVERLTWRMFDAMTDLVMRGIQWWPADIDDDPEKPR